ncbi:choice-of-anchor P family protein [Pendulispora albinea]|uniref:Curli production assembly/transport component CsgG n=1 Tax=Pendulispora albinea TaxID=2741071 RepID=A0ABZ2M6B8_9BACT
MIKSNLVRAGILGLFAASFGVVGCASGDTGGSSSDELLGDQVAQQDPGAADGDFSPARSYSGRAIAATVKVGKPNGIADYSDNVFLSDTTPLASKGGELAESLVTVNLGTLLKAGVANASTKSTKWGTLSRASVANAALFGGYAGGLLGDVLGDSGHGGDLAVDLRQILSDLGLDNLVKDLFGKGGALELGIRADVVEEDARAWCDSKGRGHSAAGVKILNLSVNGRPILVTQEPNQTIDLGIAKIIINAQDKSNRGAAIDAAAIEVTVLDVVDVKVARAAAGVTCGCSHGCGDF